MRELSPRDTIDHMHDLFLHVYSLSHGRSNEAFARKMLEQDIALLGNYFGLPDSRDHQAGRSLLAECLAYLRIKDTMVSADKVIDSYIETILAELGAKQVIYPVSSDDSPRELVRHMQTLRLSQHMLQNGHITSEEDRQLCTGFSHLANFFLLRDGSVSDKEMSTIAEFEAQLTRRDYL